jgi:hypothetical protein
MQHLEPSSRQELIAKLKLAIMAGENLLRVADEAMSIVRANNEKKAKNERHNP